MNRDMNRPYIVHQLLSGNPAALRNCGRFLSPGDIVVLAGAGSDFLANDFQDGWSLISESGCRLTMLEPDSGSIQSHSLSSEVAIEMINDEEWVNLVVASEKTLSWK